MSKHTTYLQLRDAQVALSVGKLRSDTRVQVKMPAFVVKALDALFPDTDRSTLLTSLAVDTLVRRLELDHDAPARLAAQDQAGLDTLILYLEERERADS
ncbi:MAG: hypothetical protein H6774_02425 [Pseudomonadales bacterium]|nr:hypothetical protein [Candidatus Woesebacteria bacterium]MCB9801920.1 hypothetical protein [Pseudomonadales bacterium]